MRRLAAASFVLFVLVSAAPAQQHETPAAGQEAGHAAPKGEHGGGGAAGGHANLDGWKWANFLLLAGGLGWLINKNAGTFFAVRSREIRKAMIDAEEIRAGAEKRAAAVDAMMANLQTEIETMRQEAAREREVERERMRRETAAEMAKIQAHAEQEIVSAGKAARIELRRHAADAAVELAEQKIRGRITPQTQDALLRSFVSNLREPGSPEAAS